MKEFFPEFKYKKLKKEKQTKITKKQLKNYDNDLLTATKFNKTYDFISNDFVRYKKALIIYLEFLLIDPLYAEELEKDSYFQKAFSNLKLTPSVIKRIIYNKVNTTDLYNKENKKPYFNNLISKNQLNSDNQCICEYKECNMLFDSNYELKCHILLCHIKNKYYYD